MNFVVLATLAGTLASAQLNKVVQPAHDLARRQATATTAPTGGASSSASSPAATRTGAATLTVPAASSGVPTGGTVASSPLASLSSIGTTTTSEATQALPTTFAPGATPPVSGAPSLPNIATLNPANYPPLDRLPPTDSPEVQEWLSQIDLSVVPGNAPTGLNGCSNTTVNADALADAGEDGNCWWTCGGWYVAQGCPLEGQELMPRRRPGSTRATDITYCPRKEDWGASFDDGPSPYTPRLLNLLESQGLKSTFFIVGSRAISRPEMVQTEYMLGHQLSVHTWAHSSLTTLTNEEIVAELGWTMKVIKDITGVTPNTFRPPYGDIDDRVRAIALQMGLRPIIWTTYNNEVFDTRDWQIGGGVVTAPEVYNRFESFLSEASSSLSTGFIVLAHDLYQQSVDLAVDYILPNVINQGRLKIKTIASCLGQSLEESYMETANFTSEDLLQTTSTVVGATGNGFVELVSNSAASSGTSRTSSSRPTGTQSGSAEEANASGGAGGTSGAEGVRAAATAVGMGAALVAAVLMQ
ncbi:putative chitin deacetylase [Rhodotorula diobovata]|uniref:chitin deacetylase n=1 Tax=Rhodotorula diobovata TaxID=5288 RepID=A0A5C5G2D6_9BASI|nr:putative chitin deacetylase [Rhodotorula diobovata]